MIITYNDFSISVAEGTNKLRNEDMAMAIPKTLKINHVRLTILYLSNLKHEDNCCLIILEIVYLFAGYIEARKPPGTWVTKYPQKNDISIATNDPRVQLICRTGNIIIYLYFIVLIFKIIRNIANHKSIKFTKV